AARSGSPLPSVRNQVVSAVWTQSEGQQAHNPFLRRAAHPVHHIAAADIQAAAHPENGVADEPAQCADVQQPAPAASSPQSASAAPAFEYCPAGTDCFPTPSAAAAVGVPPP